jgi:dihydrofolate synthase/folylpolyglutamate synthase
VLRRAAREAGAPFFLVGRDVRREPAGPGGAPGEFSLRFVTPDRKGETRVPGLRVALAGGYQVENAALACLALRAAGIQVPAARVRRALATAAWPGRLQVVARDPTIIFDVSHNPPALAILLDNLRELYPDRKPCFVFGVLSDKDYRLMIRYLGQAGHAFTFTRPDSPRARDPRVLAAYFRRIYPGRPCREEPDPVEAVRSAAAALEPGGLLCVCGSFYLAPILRLFPDASATGVPGS